ncbi:putative spermidine/putrescine transport system permease protein [Bradyrhizobium sp. GM22.5]
MTKYSMILPDNWRRWLPALAPAVALLAIFLVVPAAIVMRVSFYPGSTSIGATGFSLDQYVKFFSSSYYISILLETLAYAVAVCVGCLVLGFPVGYSLARDTPAKRRRRMLLVIVPLTLSLVIVVFGWLVLLGRQGLINNILIGLGIASNPQQLLFNRGAVILVLVQQFLPYMILSVMNVVMQIDPVLEQASTSLRAGRIKTFAKVIIPLSAPGLLSGLSLVFVMAVSAFVTPRLVGGPKAQMTGGIIYDQILVTGNWPLGAAQAFILLTVGFGVLGIMNLAIARPLTHGMNAR